MDLVVFYIDVLRHAVSNRPTWLIYRASLTSCVGIHDNCADALAAAIPMAEYCVAAGQHAQIRVRDGVGAPWRTVWPAPA